MAEVNQRDRTVKVKIVYYGPALGGKTTNLQVLHRHAPAGRRGDMVSVNSLQDRTILFDLLPLTTMGLRGFDLCLQLLAVPGQAVYTATRRVALKGVDGVVFVANSAADRKRENLQSLQELEQYLLLHQIDPASIPLVLQYNKRDLPQVAALETLDRELNKRRAAAVPAVAIRGEGVLETLLAILARTLADLCRRFRALELPADQTPEGWARGAVIGMFGRLSLARPAEPAMQLVRPRHAEFGVPAEFELEPAPAADSAPPDTRTIRVAVGTQASLAPSKPVGPAALAEAYAEACSQLALDLTELRAQHSLSERRLAEVRRAAAAAHRLPSADAKVRLDHVLAALGEADPSRAAVALWESACRTEEQLERPGETLLQSQKLASMSTLLAGVAHELNNPLTVVVGQAAVLRRAAGAGPLAQHAEMIVRAAERCARIVQNFLALTRQHPTERRRVDLNRVAQETLELLAYQLRVDDVDLELDLEGGLPEIWADPHQLQQVIVNLVTNARQALGAASGSRRIVVATRADRAGSRVVLRVSDNGPGVPPDLRERIFEPFFTTKGPGEGTGLGLSLSHGIAAAHGGELRLERGTGPGACFALELPLGTPAEERAPVEAAVAPVQGKTILVVDDEPALADTLVHMLAADGHAVDTAEDGEVALGKLERRAYDMILSDIRMPRLDGPGLYRRVAQAHPELLPRFVFITGDRVGAQGSAFVERAHVTCLTKPVSFDDVRGALRAVTRAAAADATARVH